MVATLSTPVVQSLRDEKPFDEKAIDELKKCLHQNSTDVYFQNSTNCKGNPKSECVCYTNLNQATNATVACGKLNGKIINKQKKVCKHNVQNNAKLFNMADLSQNCQDKEGAISYACWANPKRLCRCESVFLWYVTRREASEICKKANGKLTGSSGKIEKNGAEVFFEHLSNKYPIRQYIKNHTKLNLDENYSTYVDWSKAKKYIQRKKTRLCRLFATSK